MVGFKVFNQTGWEDIGWGVGLGVVWTCESRLLISCVTRRIRAALCELFGTSVQYVRGEGLSLDQYALDLIQKISESQAAARRATEIFFTPWSVGNNLLLNDSSLHHYSVMMFWFIVLVHSAVARFANSSLR